MVETQTDPRGLTITNTWDALYRVIRVGSPLGSIVNTYSKLDLVQSVNQLGITDDSEWRGFVVWPDGTWLPVSRFNQPDGGSRMPPDLAAEVEQALRRAGLIP